MNPEKIDLEQAILIAISSDRYLLNKAIDEGFEPELLRSSPGRIVATTLMSPRDQGVATMDALLLKAQIEERVLSARLMGKESGLNPTALLTDDLGNVPGGAERMARGLTEMHRYGRFLFLVEGNRHDTIERIRASAYNLMHEFRVESTAIFLDYLQKIPLINPPNEARARIDEISTGLADLSLELACPVFAISSIDKEGCRLDDEPTGEDRYDELQVRPRPTMHNCNGGGDIEYDLDVALILSKDWHATKELEELLKSKYSGGKYPKIDIMVLHIDKNRDAPQEAGAAIQYAFFVHENRFVELDYKTEDQDRPDFHQFAKVQEIFSFLTAQGHLGSARSNVARFNG